MIKARIQKGNWSPDVDVLLYDDCKMEFEVDDKQGVYIEPTFHLSYENAQQLMDDLWVCGLRPSEGTGSAGALAATQKHLEDMRKLVFEKKNA